MLFKELFRWIGGRQDSGYQRMLVFRSKLVRADMYLLRFPKGSAIADHVDTVGAGRHFRMNVIVKKAAHGGYFQCRHCIIDLPRLKVFRPDLHRHSVTRVKAGTRYVLSIGWVLNEKKGSPNHAQDNAAPRSDETPKGTP